MMPLILVLVSLTTVGAVAFPIVYLTLPWRSTRAGVAAMTLGTALAVILVLTSISAVFGVDFPLWVVLAAYAILCCGVWWQFLTLLSYVRRRHGETRETEKVG